MKKIILFLTGIFLVGSISFSQEDTSYQDLQFQSKKGVPILPETGDIALGINAIPLLNYVGNIMNASAFNTTNFNFVDLNQTIYLKYFLDTRTAVRVKIRIAQNSIINNEYVIKDQLVPDPLDVVEDKYVFSITNIYLNLGYELRSAQPRRAQGFYGGEVTFGYATSSDKYEYGNSITSDFTNPSYIDFGNNVTANGRVTDKDYGNTFALGLRGFIGIEYFFAPKLSLGGEFGWGFAYNTTGKGEENAEIWNGTEIEVSDTKTIGDRTWGIDTDNYFGNIFLLFHF